MNDNTKIKATIHGLPPWIDQHRLEKIVTDQIIKWLAKQKAPVLPPTHTDKPSMRKLFK